MCALGSQTQEVGALRILDDAHPPDVHHVERVGVDGRAELLGACERVVGALDGDVGVPDRRHAGVALLLGLRQRSRRRPCRRASSSSSRRRRRPGCRSPPSRTAPCRRPWRSPGRSSSDPPTRRCPVCSSFVRPSGRPYHRVGAASGRFREPLDHPEEEDMPGFTVKNLMRTSTTPRPTVAVRPRGQIRPRATSTPTTSGSATSATTRTSARRSVTTTASRRRRTSSSAARAG